MNMMACSGIPTLTKSMNRYPPAVITREFVGEAIGVANAIPDAAATAIANVYGFASIANAAARAIGVKRTAVAVLLTNCPNTTVNA